MSAYFAGTVQWIIKGDKDKARRELTGLALRLLHVARNAKDLGNLVHYDTGWHNYPAGNIRVLTQRGIDTIYMEAAVVPPAKGKVFPRVSLAYAVYDWEYYIQGWILATPDLVPKDIFVTYPQSRYDKTTHTWDDDWKPAEWWFPMYENSANCSMERDLENTTIEQTVTHQCVLETGCGRQWDGIPACHYAITTDQYAWKPKTTNECSIGNYVGITKTHSKDTDVASCVPCDDFMYMVQTETRAYVTEEGQQLPYLPYNLQETSIPYIVESMGIPSYHMSDRGDLVEMFWVRDSYTLNHTASVLWWIITGWSWPPDWWDTQQIKTYKYQLTYNGEEIENPAQITWTSVIAGVRNPYPGHYTVYRKTATGVSSSIDAAKFCYLNMPWWKYFEITDAGGELTDSQKKDIFLYSLGIKDIDESYEIIGSEIIWGNNDAMRAQRFGAVYNDDFLGKPSGYKPTHEIPWSKDEYGYDRLWISYDKYGARFESMGYMDVIRHDPSLQWDEKYIG